METIQFPTKTKAKKSHKCNFCNQPIEIGEIYWKSVHKYDGVYSWKAHLDCSDIADTLKMYDHADEGVTMDDFVETIKNEYCNIMSEHHTEQYEATGFSYPDFPTRLNFVIAHHKPLNQ